MRGWLDALQAAAVTPAVVHVADNVLRGGSASGDGAARRAATGRRRCCASPTCSLRRGRRRRRARLAVPDDLSVVGFDDSPAASRRTPRLTTVRQDVAAKGRAAARALITAIERAAANGKPRARHLVLPTELVVRQSTAPPAVERPRRRP